MQTENNVAAQAGDEPMRSGQNLMAKRTEREVFDELKLRVRYDGENLIWFDAKNKYLNGEICGRRESHGYRRIFLRNHGMVQVHRVIFYMVHGFLPTVVDHADGNSLNNSVENLRAATISQNATNCKTPVTNTSGRKGVYLHKLTGKWQASIRAEDKLKHLGLFEKFEDAVKARETAEEKYHGTFKRH